MCLFKIPVPLLIFDLIELTFGTLFATTYYLALSEVSYGRNPE